MSFRPLARLAMTDAEHTANDGHYQSAVWAMSESGVIAGTSTRYSSGDPNTPRGNTTWLADASGRMVQVGFDDAAHTDATTGVQESYFVALTRTGIALGFSRRPGLGQTAWRATLDGGTVRLGFYEGAYATSWNNRPPTSSALDINSDGVAVGYSVRSDGRSTGWMVDEAGNHTVLSPPGAQFESPTGTIVSEGLEINDDGFILGTSISWFESTPGQEGERETAWLRSPDGSYVAWEQGTYTGAWGLNENGYFTLRHGLSDTADIVHVSGSFRTVGFGGGEDVSTSILAINSSGGVVGQTGLYFRPADRTWISMPGQPRQRLTLLDYYAMRGDGMQLVSLNDSGIAAGYAVHIDGSTAAWHADPSGNVTRIGLYGGVYYGPAGAREEPVHQSYPAGLTESGLIWGHSVRLDGDWENEGQTAWIHHVATGTATPLELSVRASDGFAFSQINRVLESGIAIGTFTKFGSAGQDLGARAFVRLPGHGVLDVDQNTTVSLAAAGWRHLSSVDAATDGGLMAGVGVVSGAPLRSRAVFVIQLVDEPPAPPPAGDLLFYLGRLGLYDGRHTGPSGQRDNRLVDFADTGYSLGSAVLYVGANDVPAASGRMAQSAWLGNPAGATRRIGLYDALHTRDDGRQENTPVAVNRGGVTIGHAARFSGHAYRGETAWVADRHGTVLRIGYYDAAHTGTDGTKLSRPVALNAANRLVGYSQHPDTLSTTAWLATSTGAIQRIGFVDTAHTAPDGTRVSVPFDLNDAGYAVGTSEHYIPGVAMTGLTAWLRHPGGVLRRVGFETGVHRAPNGQHESQVVFLNASTRLAGYSVRFHPTEPRAVGRTAWLTHVDGPNKPIGFYGRRHTGAANLAHSGIVGLNDAGYAIGYSAQFTPTSGTPADARGRTAWIARPDATTVRVGLYGAAYNRGGFQYNVPRRQDDAGGLAGTAERYIDGVYRGLDAWVADETGATWRIGLLDARHVRSDLHRISTPGPMTASGWVAGTSARYHGLADAGQTAWIYHRATGAYQRFEFSVRATDGYAYAVITHLLEDGRARGVFRKFSSSGASLGDRAFIYTPGQGARELGYATDVALADRGWALFGRADHATGGGLIAGEGELLGSASPRRGVYLVRE